MSRPRGPMTVRQRLNRFLFGMGEGVRIAFDAIRINPFRSGLTVLGVGVGVCVVVLVAALISGIRGSLAEGIEASGPRNLFVAIQDPSEITLVNDGSMPDWMRRPRFTEDELARVAQVGGVDGVLATRGIPPAPGSEAGIVVRLGTTEVSGVNGVGHSPGWAPLNQVDFVEGRDFVTVEFQEARAVLIVSEQLARDLVGEAPIVGTRVHLVAGPDGGLPMTVVGVMVPPANPFSDEAAHQAVVPVTTAMRRLGAARTLSEFVVVPAPDVVLDQVEDGVISALRTMRGLAPGEENNFAVIRATELLEFFDRFTFVFFVVMLALSSAGLLVGGVGVVGIMLISVTERTREIGVRKALGATRGEILWQFLVEAGVLTALGAATGLLLGGGLAALTAWLTPVPASIPLWAVIASLTAAAVTGMGFGLFPALRAARMDPVVALRYE
jgi:putative ABC transport system permease protein